MGAVLVAICLLEGAWLTQHRHALARTMTADRGGSTSSATPIRSELQVSSSPALKDFQARCASPGVFVCEGFDEASKFVPGHSPNTGLYPGSDNTIEIVQDTTIKASGNGSLRFPIKANDGTGNTVRDDNWLLNFGRTFGQNTNFYVQFRYRVDAAYVNTNWEEPENGESSPKIADFAYHNSSCGQTEITTNNRGGMAMPMMYTSCGGRGFFVNPGTTIWNDSSPPYQWQNGFYNCAYKWDPGKPGGCFKMSADKWMTFYYRIQLGDWGQPNSHITASVGPEGQPLQPFVDITNMAMKADTPGYDAIWFNVYMTGFLATARNPAANVWLDEVIVSTGPIPAPADNPQPAPRKP
jgi:hypothetical protein